MPDGVIFKGSFSFCCFPLLFNAGETFIHGFLPGTTGKATPPGIYPRVSDPSVAFDAKHNVWIISYLGLFSHGNTAEVDVLSSRSTDGGLTWGNPVVVNTSGAFNDKNWTVFDDTASSPFFGNCYTEFDAFSKLILFQMSTSTDGGLMWGTPTTDPDHPYVIVPIDDCLESILLSFRSTNGGKTWSKRVLAAQLLTDLHPGVIRAPTLPSADVSAHLGLVYYFFPNIACDFTTCKLNVGFLSSTNGEATWSSAEDWLDQ